MRNISFLWSLIFSVLLLNNCSQNNHVQFLNAADYDASTHTLHIDYKSNPDTSLIQIIALSNIRKSGYGVVLNLDNAYSEIELKSMKLNLQKQDINAVHSFNISINDSLESKIKVAMKGAKFIWLINSNKLDWKTKAIGNNLETIQNNTETRPLLVLNKN